MNEAEIEYCVSHINSIHLHVCTRYTVWKKNAAFSRFDRKGIACFFKKRTTSGFPKTEVLTFVMNLNGFLKEIWI